jgi:hypothetical protein
MTSDEASVLVEQIRVAHRLSAGFYQRLLPVLADIANDQGLEFWYWRPAYTSRPCRSSTPPNNNWAWDMLPMFASQHVYRRVRGGSAAQGDLALMFEVCLDDTFRPEARKLHGVKGEPDPLTLPEGRALVEASVFRCLGEDTRTFDKIWNETGSPEPTIQGWQKLHDKLEASVLTYHLANFISAPRKIADDISRKIAE